MANTIKLKSYSKVIEEYEAANAITPGMLVEITSAGKVQRHSGVGRNVLPMIAIEDELQGKGIKDAYAAGDQVQVWIPYRGDIVNGMLADGQNVVVGDFVMSNGNGFFTKYVQESWESNDAQQANILYPMVITGQVVEAQDLSGLEGSESSLATNAQHIAIRIV